LEELGLSPDEIAQLEAMQKADQPAPPAPTAAEPELTPFSLEELGLSPDEIAQLEAMQKADQPAPTAPAAAEPELPPFSLEELGLSPDEIAQLEAMQKADQPAPPAPAAAEPELTPFSLEELGLSPEEIAQLETMQEAGQRPAETIALIDEPIGSQTEPTGTSEGLAATSEASFELPGLEPFSLDEFGDLEPFSFEDLESGITTGGELAISPEEIENLNLGNFETVVFTEDEEPLIDTGDPVLNRLIQLGHRQGYVDITDIIAVVQDPEREADRIEQIGWSLHRAGIQIRDGDEIIDMEADVEEEEFATPAETPSVPITSAMPAAAADLTPFTEEVSTAEPELTPFSLEELGLSPDEIAQLEAMQKADQPAPPAPAAAEPELTPFSLEELGLSPEEIAQLEAMQKADQPASATETPAAGQSSQPSSRQVEVDEEELFDFSLAETTPVAKAVRTNPRIEEPPPAPKPEDVGFVPEPLDALDDIWQATSEPPAQEPARVVLPPLSERVKPQPAAQSRAIGATEERRSVAPTRDDLRFARREAATIGRGRSARAPLRPRALEDFIPTGNAKLDEYLHQLSANPNNHTLAFTIARLCAQTGQAELMAVVYRRLLKQTDLLDRLVEELEDLINTVDTTPVLRQLHRLLGDAYSRQGRLDEAIAAYSVTFSE
ncbi:MAG: hypothetical protein K6356_08045, partial [Chloroflexus sp.]